MRKVLMAALASASALALGVHTAAAQQASVEPNIAEEAQSLGEIVVTARRQVESLQEVPQTVNAVTADTLAKLNIIQFQDIQNVVPGLSLQQGNSGFNASASLRGVSYDGVSTSSPTVAMYLNDAPIRAVSLFQAMFDIGQIEVLKGPQGTTRGISAPSGAITVTTRKPSLSEFGGYLDVTATDLQGRNVNGAINVPIIRDVLGVRIAGMIDQTDFDGVRSINNNLEPRQVISAGRISLSFEPNDAFNATVAYQHTDRDQRGFQQVMGPGRLSQTSPPITAGQRLAVGDEPTTFRQHQDNVTAQLDSRIYGHHLSYVGSYGFIKINQATAQDNGNVLPGIEPFQLTGTSSETTTHEFRLSSEPNGERLFDYTVGAFYSWSASEVDVTNPGQLQRGAFGPPGAAPNLTAYDPRYQIPTLIRGPGSAQETAVFGNVTLHLGSRTELSGGLRHIYSISNSNRAITLGDGLLALPPGTPFGGAVIPPCAAAGFASTYPGFCDVPVPGGRVVANLVERTSVNPTIYNVSLSHHLTRDILLYANTGSAYRPPDDSVGLQGDLASTSNPLLRTLTFHPAEKSTAYEVGFKSTLLDGRARLNGALFRQKFNNLTVLVPGINYRNTAAGGQVVQADITASVDAVITGFDLDAAYQVTPEWNVSAQVSYAHGKSKGSSAPCNTFDGAGAPTFNTDNLISLCPGGSPSRLPLWSLTAQTEYVRPVADGMDGFVRGLLNYYPENKYVRPDFTADNYSLLNLYAGLRGDDGSWEVSLFARNAFNTNEELDRGENQYNLNGSLGTNFSSLNAPSGYFYTRSTPRREIGVHLRYALGSRKSDRAWHPSLLPSTAGSPTRRSGDLFSQHASRGSTTGGAAQP